MTTNFQSFKKTMMTIVFIMLTNICAWAQLNWSGTVSYSANTSISQKITLTGDVTVDVPSELAVVINAEITGNFSLTKTGMGFLVFNRANTYTGHTTISGGTLEVGDENALIFSSGVTLTSNNARLNLSLIGNNPIRSLNATSSLAEVFLGEKTLSLSSSNGGGTFAGRITGSGNFIKNGKETFYLTGNIASTVTTSIEEGYFFIGNNTATGSVDGPITNNSGLYFYRNNPHLHESRISGTGFVSLWTTSTSAPLTLTGVQYYTGATYIGGILILDGRIESSSEVIFERSANAQLTLPSSVNYKSKRIKGLRQLGGDFGKIVLENANILCVGTSISTNDGGGSFSGVISGSGGILKTGTATLTLTGANTYPGTTRVEAGTLQVGGATDVSIASTSDVVLLEGTVLRFQMGANANFNKVISGGGRVVKAGAADLRLTVDNTYTGTTTVESGLLQLGNNTSTGSVAGDIVIQTGGTLNFYRSNPYEFKGVISGAGSIRKSGTAMLTLSGANTYTGITDIQAGTLALASTGSIAASSSVTVSAGAFFDISQGGNKTIKALNGSGKVVLVPSSLLTIGTSATSNDGGGTYNGDFVFTPTGSIIKTGTQKLILDKDSYTGLNITIQSGTLETPASLYGTTQEVILSSAASVLRLTGRTATGQTIPAISGAGRVEINTPYYVLFLGKNTYSGSTTIEAGRLTFYTSSLAGSIENSSVILTGATSVLDVSGVSQKISGLSGTNASANVLIGGTRTLTVNQTGNSSYAGTITTNGSGGILLKSGAGALTLNGAVSSAATISEGSLIFNSAMSGATTISAGTLILGASATVTNSGGIVMNGATSKLDISAGNQTISRLTGDNPDAQVILGNRTLTINNTAYSTYRGSFSGSGGSVTKTGAGDLYLQNKNNTATGTFTCSNGRVTFRQYYNYSGGWSDPNHWAGNLTINTGATLYVEGNCTVGGALTMQSGTINFSLSEDNPSRISASGAFSASGTNTLNLTLSDSSDDYILISAASGISTTPFSVSGAEGTLTATPTELKFSPDYIPVEGINFEVDNITLVVGDEGEIWAGVEPYNATFKSFTFESANTAVAIVTSGGTVRAVGVGETVISIGSKDPDYTKVHPFHVTVVDIEQGDLTVAPDYLYMETGDVRSVGAVAVTDPYATPIPVSNVTWESSNHTVAVVDESGLVTAISPGETVITATTAGGVTATCNVTVVRKPPAKPQPPKVILVSGAVEKGTITEGALKHGSIVRLVSDTGHALKYTTDGSDPTASSSIWPASGANSITVNGAMTIRAVAVNEDVFSNELVCTYQPPTLESPYALPLPVTGRNEFYGTGVGLFQTGFTGGNIRYTIDGSEPDVKSLLYKTAIPLNEAVKYESNLRVIRAKSFGDGFNESPTKRFGYSVQVAMPVLDVWTGAITCATDGAQIRYTLNGGTPTTSSMLYTSTPIPILTTPQTVRIIAFKDGFLPSNMETRVLVQKAPTPTMRITGTGGGPVNDQALTMVVAGTEVTIITPSGIGAYTRYTTNGAEPTTGSNSGNTIIINSAITVKAKTFRSGWTESETAVFKFGIIPPPPAPTASVPSGSTVTYESTVQLSASGCDGFIYTIDGSTPTIENESGKYNGKQSTDGKIVIRQEGVVKVIAYKEAFGRYACSPVASFTYKVPPVPVNFDMGDVNVTIPGGTPMLGNRQINLLLNTIASSMFGSNGKFRIAIGENFAKGKDLAGRNADFEKLKNAMNAAKRDDVKKVIDPIRKATTMASVSCEFEVAGYLESLVTSEGIPTGFDGKIMVYAGASAEWETWIVILNVGVGFHGTITYWGGSKLDITANPKISEPQSMLEYSLGVSARAGVGVPLVASVGIWGSASFHHKWDMVRKYNKMWLNGQVGVYEKFLFWTWKQTVLNGNWNIWASPSNWDGSFTPSSVKSSLSASGMPESFHLENYTLMPRNYLTKQSPWLGSSPQMKRTSVTSTFTALQQSVFPETAPFIAEAGGKRVMVFLADDPVRDDYNRTVLMYSVNNTVTNTWSDPQAVHDNGTADFNPGIATDGTNIWVAWQRSKTTFTAASTIEDMMAAGEIAVAKFNPATDIFGTPTVLTNNNFMDVTPQIAAHNGNAMVTWIQNANNDVNGTKGNANKIMASQFTGTWQNAAEVKSGLNAVTDLNAGYINSKFQIAYITDRDNKLGTIDDRDLLVVDLTGAVSHTPASNKTVSGVRFTSIGSTKVLSWFEDGKLRYMPEGGAAQDLTAKADMTTDNYKIFTNGTQSAVVYPDLTDEVGYLYVRDVVSGQLTAPYRLAKTGGIAQYFDGVLENNGVFNIVFNNSTIELVDTGIENEDGIIELDIVEQNDLLTLKMAPPVNIRLTGIDYEQEEVRLGESLPVRLDVANIGGVAVKEVMVKVDGVTAGAYTVNLATGDNASIDFSLNVPSGMAPMTEFDISVVPVSLTDVDLSDNNFTVKLGYVNFSMLLDTNSEYTIVEDESGDGYKGQKTVTVTANITNNSDFAAKAQLITRLGSADGEIIDMVNLGSIDGRDNRVIERIYNIESLFSVNKDDGKQEQKKYMRLYFELITDMDAEYGVSDFVMVYDVNDEPLPLREVNIAGYAYEMVDGEEAPLADVSAAIWVAKDEHGANAKLWQVPAGGDEQKNLQITDESGWFGWNVPDGWWQVRLTKDDFDDAQSAWLPIPPKQFDVHIEMMRKPFVAVTGITGIPETAVAGKALTLAGTVVPAEATFKTIVWSMVSAGTTNATIDGATFSATAAGTVTIRATIANGKAIDEDYVQEFTITVSIPTGYELSDRPLARAYPNPTNNAFFLSFEAPGEYGLTLTDMAGKVVLRQTTADQPARIDISHLSQGVYMLIIENGKKVSVMRIVKD